MLYAYVREDELEQEQEQQQEQKQEDEDEHDGDKDRCNVYTNLPDNDSGGRVVNMHMYGHRDLPCTKAHTDNFQTTENIRGARGIQRSRTKMEHGVLPRRRQDRTRHGEHHRDERGVCDRMDRIRDINMIAQVGRVQHIDHTRETESMRSFTGSGSSESRKGGYAKNFYWPVDRKDYRRDHFRSEDNVMSRNIPRQVEVPVFSRYIDQYRTKMCMDRHCSSTSCEFAHDRRQMRCSFYWGSKGCHNAEKCAYAHG